MADKLRVFIPYFGAKFMRALRNHEKNVILLDKSEYICGVWDYLIHAPAAEIRALPLMQPGDDVQDLEICKEAQWLLGFWINQGSTMPKRTMGGRASNRKFGTWGEAPRERLAQQVEHIRHWKIIHGDYAQAPDIEATWFIDSPYEGQGKQYKHTVKSYGELGAWCRARKGQVMVCESQGATWLPFEPVTTVCGATHKITQEMLWVGGSDG